MAGDKSNIPSLKAFFDCKVAVYNQVSFIKDDPICIPHLFSTKQDIEIAGFLQAFLHGVTEPPSYKNLKS